MKLGEILTGRAGGVYVAPTRKVRFKIMGKDASGAQVVADAEAVLAFVPEDERAEARVQSDKALRDKFPGGEIPADILGDERVYWVLLRALRDADDPRQPFAKSVVELKQALHRRVVGALFADYEQFCEDEFPEQIRDDQFEGLVEEAKKKSLADLLSSVDSSTILRALPSLVAHFGRSPTETSGVSSPG